MPTYFSIKNRAFLQTVLQAVAAQGPIRSTGSTECQTFITRPKVRPSVRRHTSNPRTTKKEAKKVVVMASKLETQNSSQNFTRNSAKYATLPAKRTSDIIHLESEHHSDTEQGVKEESSDEEEDDTISSAKPAKHKA